MKQSCIKFKKVIDVLLAPDPIKGVFKYNLARKAKEKKGTKVDTILHSAAY